VKNQKEQNLLELIPERIRPFEKEEDGHVSIIQPKFTNKFFIKYLAPRLKNAYFRIHLDEFGSKVWELCDGQNTIEYIGEQLHQTFGDKVEPVYERLAAFFQYLYRLKFIHYTNYVPKSGS